MPKVCQYHIYHCTHALAGELQGLLSPLSAEMLRPLMQNSFSGSFLLDDSKLTQDVLILRAFDDSDFAKTFLLVPIPYSELGKDETLADFHARTVRLGLERLQLFLGSDYNETALVFSGAFVWDIPDADAFDIKEELSPKRISRFLRGNETLARAQPFQWNTIQYWVEGNGVGVIAPKADDHAVKQWLVMLALAKAYLMVFEQINRKIGELGVKSSDDEPEQLLTQFDGFNRFLLSHYFDSPIRHSDTMAYTGYQHIRKNLYVHEQYLETVEMLRLIGEIGKSRRYRSQQREQLHLQAAQHEILLELRRQHREKRLAAAALGVLLILLLLAVLIK